MGYTLTTVDNGVLIANDTGYSCFVNGYVAINYREYTDTPSEFVITPPGLAQLKIRADQFDTIGGDAPAGTDMGILLQLAALFNSALPPVGTGNGSFLEITATAGTTVTNATLIGTTVVALVINDTFKSTGFSGPDGSGTVTLTDGTTFGNGDIVIVLYTT